jgi:hypothetical protein
MRNNCEQDNKKKGMVAFFEFLEWQILTKRALIDPTSSPQKKYNKKTVPKCLAKLNLMKKGIFS